MKTLWLKDKYIKVENKKIRKMFARQTPFKKKMAGRALLILSKNRPKKKSIIRDTESHHV